MKVMYLGASCRSGLSAKNDSPYTIAEVLFAVPDKPAAKADPNGAQRWTYACHGYRTQTIELDPAALSAFGKVQPFTMVELAIEPVPENPSRNRVTGVKS